MVISTPWCACIRGGRGEGAPGAQGFQVAHFEAVAAEEQLSVQGEGGVAGGEDEAVTTFPAVVGGILVPDLLEEQVGDRRQARAVPGWPDPTLSTASAAGYVRYLRRAGRFSVHWSSLPRGVLSQREWMRQQVLVRAVCRV